MSSLAASLAAARAEREAKRDPAVNALMHRAIDDLRASGIADRIRGVGDAAPMFARPSIRGETVRLRSLLSRGPAIVSFFRGRW